MPLEIQPEKPEAHSKGAKFYLSAPGGKFSRELGSQSKTYARFDTDRRMGCIRDVDHAYFKDGGLAVLTGNIARNGCIVKTAGVDESLFVFRGRPKYSNRRNKP